MHSVWLYLTPHNKFLHPDDTLRYDHETQHAFIGDYSGQITLLKLEKQTYSTITTLKGHEGKGFEKWKCFNDS